MGPMSMREKEVLGVLFAAAVLWVGGPYAEAFFGLPRTLFSSAIVAVMAVSHMVIRDGLLDQVDVTETITPPDAGGHSRANRR